MIKRSFEIVLGTIFLIASIIGFIVPIIPGWLLLFSGIVLISPHHGKKIVDWIKKRLQELKNSRKKH